MLVIHFLIMVLDCFNVLRGKNCMCVSLSIFRSRPTIKVSEQRIVIKRNIYVPNCWELRTPLCGFFWNTIFSPSKSINYTSIIKTLYRSVDSHENAFIRFANVTCLIYAKVHFAVLTPCRCKVGHTLECKCSRNRTRLLCEKVEIFSSLFNS